MPSYLPNPFYAALRQTHAPFSVANGAALRYRPEYIPFAAVADLSEEAFTDLRELLAPDEAIFITTDGTAKPTGRLQGLEEVLLLPALQMRFTGGAPAGSDEQFLELLGTANVAEMLALKDIAFPGYVGPGFHELGQFLGVRDAETQQLVAMGGARLCTNTYREMSAVCTHPAHRSRGYGAQIIRGLVRQQLALGEHPMLHVLENNGNAIALYQHLGFEISGTLNFRRLRRV